MNYYKEVSDIVNSMMANGKVKYTKEGFDDSWAARIAYAEIIGRLQVVVAALLFNHRDPKEAQKELDKLRNM